MDLTGRSRIALAIACLFLSFVLFWTLFRKPNGSEEKYPKLDTPEIKAMEEPDELDPSVEEPKQPKRKEVLSELEPGDEIEDPKNPRLLRHYGELDRTGSDDLKLVNFVLDRFWQLIKDPDQLVVGSNEDIMRSLSGANSQRIAFVSPENRFIDKEGRLLDRWGAPLFFHAESMTRIGIRSSGPDLKRFTEDDIVRTASTSQGFRN